MFRSVSACTPNSQIIVDFVSSQNQDFYTAETATVRVNGTAAPTLPVFLNTGDLVEMVITTPVNYLDYKFYEYILNGTTQYFAVANKSLYNPQVKPADASKKWFNYQPSVFQISFYSDPEQDQFAFGFGRRIVNIQTSHVVLDHIHDAVCFYANGSQEMIARVNIPGGPIEYKKTSYIKTDGTTDTEVIVLCNDGKLYRVRFNHEFSGSNRFKPVVIPVSLANNLSFEQDLPTGETYIEARRNRLLSKLFPLITSFDIQGQYIWLAGYDSVFIVNKNFTLVNHIIIENQTILSIACLNNDAIVTTRAGAAYYVNPTGTIKFLYSTTALGTPCSFNNGTAVALPDPNNQRLLIFVDDSTAHTLWLTPEFVPAYVREFDGNLWVTGHDNNRVLRFTSPSTFDVFDFKNKVTIVSAVGSSIIGVHYLQEFTTLSFPNVKKVIPFNIEPRRGSVTHIGTEPMVLKMLGQENIEVISGPGLTCWINGLSNELASTGDYLGVSYQATQPGLFRSSFVIGENAFDYDVEVVELIKSNVFIQTNLNPILANTNTYISYLTPNVGNNDNGTTGPIPLGFNFSMFGNVYSQINVGTNGYITFGNNQLTQPTDQVGGLGADAIHVETQDLYQGTGINNVNPLNIVSVPLSSGETPGVYFKTGSSNGFNFAKIRWVGTTNRSYPIGNTITTISSISNYNRIPINSADAVKVNVNDYVSGNGIVFSTRVTGINLVSSPNLSIFVSNATTNTVILTPTTNNEVNFSSLTNDFKYATVKNLSNGNIARLLNFSKNTIVANTVQVLDYNSVNTVILGESVPSVVDNTWGFKFVYRPPFSSLPVDALVQIESISPVTTTTITVISAADLRSFYVNNSDFNSVYIGQSLVSPNIVGGKSIIVQKITTDPTGLKIELFDNHTLQAGNTLTAEKTTITVLSNSLPSSNPIFGYTNPKFVQMSMELDSVNGLVTTQRTSSNISITGNYAVVSIPVTVSSGTALTFKSLVTSVPAMTYEVGLYVNDLYQFVEFFYDSPNHQSTIMSGIAAGSINYYPVKRNLHTAKSAVFYSPNRLGTGWAFLGNARVNTVSLQNKFRDVVVYKSTSIFENHARVEFLVDQNINRSTGILLSADYGFLDLNTSYYTGNANVAVNDLVSLTVPLNNSNRLISPMITLGQHQFVVPMINDNVTMPNEVVIFYDNQPVETLVSGNVTISVAGTYYIPKYYRYGLPYSELGIVFTRNRAGQTITLTNLYYELIAGDIVTVTNFITSSLPYDTREIVISGPEILKIRWRTSSVKDKFNYLNYGTLLEPYVNNIEYQSSVIAGNVVIDTFENYQTQNITLTSNTTTLVGNLYIDNPGVIFIVNGTYASSYISNVPVGANIALYREFYNYYQSNVTIYQVDFDAVTSSNIYIPIGEWNVNNRIITGGSRVDSATDLGFDLNSYFVGDKDINAGQLEINQSAETYSVPVVDKFQAVRIAESSIIDKDKIYRPIIVSYVSSLIDKIETYKVSDSSAYSTVTFSIENFKNTDSSQYSFFNSSTIAVESDLTLPAYTFNLIKTFSQFDSVKSLGTNAKIISFNKSDTSQYSFLQPKSILNLNRSISSEYSFIEIQNTPSDKSETSKYSYITSTTKSAERSISSEYLYLTSSIQVNVKSESSNLTYIFNDSIRNDQRSESSKFNFILNDTIKIDPKSGAANFSYISIDSVTIDQRSGTEDVNYIFNDDVKIDQKSGTEDVNYIFNDDVKNSRRSESSDFSYIKNDSLKNNQRSESNEFSYLRSQSNRNLQKSDSNDFSYITISAAKNYQRSVSGEFNYIKSSADRANQESDSGDFNYLRVDSLKNNSQSDSSKINFILLDTLKNKSRSDSGDFNYLILGGSRNIPQSDTSDISILLASRTGIDIDNYTQIKSKFSEIFENRFTEKTIQTVFDKLKNSSELSITIESLIEINYLLNIKSFDFEKVSPDALLYINTNFEINVDPIYTHPLPPVLDIDPEYLHPLPPVLDIETKLLPKLTLMQFYETQLIMPVNQEFDQDVMWLQTDLTKLGAFKTDINVFTDGGSRGDNITIYGPTSSEEYGRLPFVLRSKTYNYLPEINTDFVAAQLQTLKFKNAVPTRIVGTDFWNYRIYLNTKRYSVPRKGKIFPITWFVRGG